MTIGNDQLFDETISFQEKRFDKKGENKFVRGGYAISKDLKEGYHAIKILAWMPNHQSGVWDYRPLTFRFCLRDPDGTKPRDLGPDDIFYTP